MNSNALITYNSSPQNNCTLAVAHTQSTLFQLFNRFIVEYSQSGAIFVIESKIRIDLYEFAKMFRQRQKKDIEAYFNNIYYSRPISLYQLSMIINETNPYAPILIPNFLIPFKEEGLTEIEKKQQLDVLKDQLIFHSYLRPIVIGGLITEFEKYPWVLNVLEEVCTKRVILEEKQQLEKNTNSQQLALF